MPIKIQRKPIKHFPVKKEKERVEAKGFDFREAITILGGITGLVVALLWISGRFYADGYFSEMNIPLFQINFSIWEYAEASWYRIAPYFFRTISVPLFLVSISSIVFMLIVAGLQAIFPKLMIADAFNYFASQLVGLFKSYRIFVALALGMIFYYYFLLTLVDISLAGRAAGLHNVLNRSHAVDVYSKEYLPMEPYNVVPDTALFHYSGLRLLVSNSGKYYLFRDVDALTCQPAQVYIIEDTENIHLVLGEISPVTTPCAAMTTVSPTP